MSEETKIFPVFAWVNYLGQECYADEFKLQTKGQILTHSSGITMCEAGLLEAATPFGSREHSDGGDFLTKLELTGRYKGGGHWKIYEGKVLYAPVDTTSVTHQFSLDMANQITRHYLENYTNRLNNAQCCLQLLEEYARITAEIGFGVYNETLETLRREAWTIYENTYSYTPIERVARLTYRVYENSVNLGSVISNWVYYFKDFYKDEKQFTNQDYPKTELNKRLEALFVD